MEHLITRTGGESETQAGKLIPSFVIDTAGAPASASTPADGAAAAPEWIELLPAGVFYGRDGRGPFRLDDPTAVIASTTALQMNAGIPIDYDHATDFGAPEGRPAPAAGWIRELEVRTGAVWGRVEWTARAAELDRRARVPLRIARIPVRSEGRSRDAPAAGRTHQQSKSSFDRDRGVAHGGRATTKRGTNRWNFQPRNCASC